MLIILISFLMVVFWQVLASYFWGNKLKAVDVLINEWVVGVRRPLLNELMMFITMTGNGWTIFWGSVLGGLLLLITGRKKCFGALILGNIVGLMFVNFSKYAIGRFRPPMENALVRIDGFSLPSGHSYFGLVFYGLITYFLMKHFSRWKTKITIFLTGFGFILLLAMSRIYLGVHWTTDVMAGLATSAIWLGLVIAYLEKKQIYFSEKKKIEDKKLKKGLGLFATIWFLIAIGQFILTR